MSVLNWSGDNAVPKQYAGWVEVLEPLFAEVEDLELSLFAIEGFHIP